MPKMCAELSRQAAKNTDSICMPSEPTTVRYESQYVRVCNCSTSLRSMLHDLCFEPPDLF